MPKNYTESNYWDRLDKTVKTLIYNDIINSDQEFYEKLEIDKSSASLIRNGKRKIPKAKKQLLQTLFAVNLEFLEKGFRPILLTGRLDIVEEPQENYKSIPFYKTDIFATISPSMQDVITLKPDTFIRIPMFSRGQFAIQVTGNSMKGYINNGDWAVIRRISKIDKIIYGECYVIVTKDDNLRTIKFVNQDKKNDDILWLSPYNIEQFDSQSILKEDILEMYQVIGIFRRVGA